MSMYESFARVYDRFMDNVPYDEWADRLHEIFAEYGIRDGLILDLGCGTGQMTRRFRSFGYDMIGVDDSEDMLEIALEKEHVSQPASAGRTEDRSGQQYPILYLNQDMREFELYGTVRGIYSCCDCLNYLYSEEDLLTVFRLAENYLDYDGLFVFDMNTEHYYAEKLGQNTFADVEMSALLSGRTIMIRIQERMSTISQSSSERKTVSMKELRRLILRKHILLKG